jgi:Spy/CpxP family protein refolding chaperone
VLLAVGSGRAQPVFGPGGHPGRPGGAASPPNRKLEALRIWRLTQELDLTEDQAGQFFPKLKKMREVREEHRSTRRALLDELDTQLEQEPVEPANLKSVLDSLAAIDDNMREAELKLRREITELLTIEQQARLYVFEANFDREARRMIKQIKEDKDKPRGKR